MIKGQNQLKPSYRPLITLLRQLGSFCKSLRVNYWPTSFLTLIKVRCCWFHSSLDSEYVVRNEEWGVVVHPRRDHPRWSSSHRPPNVGPVTDLDHSALLAVPLSHSSSSSIRWFTWSTLPRTPSYTRDTSINQSQSLYRFLFLLSPLRPSITLAVLSPSPN